MVIAVENLRRKGVAACSEIERSDGRPVERTSAVLATPARWWCIRMCIVVHGIFHHIRTLHISRVWILKTADDEYGMVGGVNILPHHAHHTNLSINRSSILLLLYRYLYGRVESLSLTLFTSKKFPSARDIYGLVRLPICVYASNYVKLCLLYFVCYAHEWYCFTLPFMWYDIELTHNLKRFKVVDWTQIYIYIF